MQFYEINVREIMIFTLYAIYKKHGDNNNWRLNQRKIGSIITSARKILLPIVHASLGGVAVLFYFYTHA